MRHYIGRGRLCGFFQADKQNGLEFEDDPMPREGDKDEGGEGGAFARR